MTSETNREALEIEKIRAEITNLFAETAKLNAETSKIARERFWIPFTIFAGVVGAMAVLVARLLS